MLLRYYCVNILMKNVRNGIQNTDSWPEALIHPYKCAMETRKNNQALQTPVR